MFGLLFFGFVASALAAPQFDYPNYNGPYGPPIPGPVYNMPVPQDNQWPFTANVFDHNKFSNDMSNLGRNINDMMADFNKRFSNDMSNLRRNMDNMAVDLNKRYAPQRVIEGNEYKLTLPLSGFDKNDITVQPREGIIRLEAYHANAGGGSNWYSNNLLLPDIVNPNCTWSYDNSILKIVCPLKDDTSTAQPVYTV